MENFALLYIPDISGFTKFVTQTEIEHSNGTISELIEVIIKSNMLNRLFFYYRLIMRYLELQ